MRLNLSLVLVLFCLNLIDLKVLSGNNSGIDQQDFETTFEPQSLNSKPFRADSLTFKKVEKFVTSPIKTDTASWKEITGGEDFIKESEKKKEERHFNYERENVSLPSVGEGLMSVAQIILFIVIAVVLVFIVFRIVKMSRQQNRRFSEEDTFWQINLNESDSAETEIQDKLSKAIQEGNFTFAIRLYYLNCLNELNRKSIIVWKKDKTNAEYIKEIKSPKLKKPFKVLTYWFELFWFGERKADELSFRKLESTFLQFIKEIDAKI